MKIAIIGAGISGLGAAYLLNPDHEITVYEANDYIGGHSRTLEADIDGAKVPVDTGFIVYNERNYPHLTGLFNHLDVEVAKSDMSFGVSINNGWLEYGTQSLWNIISQKRNLFRPAFWRMVRDVLCFNKQAERYLESDLTLGQLLDEMNMGPWFRDYYLLAMGGAIWSTPLMQMEHYPARTFLRFFKNHGLLTVTEQPQWYTVKGGSREYVKKLTASFAEKIRLNAAVQKVKAEGEQIAVTDAKGEVAHYDQVILACHSDQAHQMLDESATVEREWLSAFRYQPNEAVLHGDLSFMPKRRSSWSSWVYLSEAKQDGSASMSLSYWMNNLQPLSTKEPVIVTLNPGREPDAEKVMNRHLFHHPVFDEAAIEAQSHIDEVNGKNGIWFAGAYQRYGFHEDGLMSGVRVAKALGAKVPWENED
jgi:predicted NAD/FAD-binding protein